MCFEGKIPSFQAEINHSNEERKGNVGASNNRRTAAQTRLWFWRWEGREGGGMMVVVGAGRMKERKGKADDGMPALSKRAPPRCVSGKVRKLEQLHFKIEC